MEIKYKVISDEGQVYEPDSIITSTGLVEDYIACLNEIEDKELIEYLNHLIENNYHATAVKFIQEMWNIQLEEI